MGIPLITDRWLDLAGRVLSGAGVGKWTVPSKKRPTQNVTGPFDSYRVNKTIGFTEYGDFGFTLWADLTYQTLIDGLKSSSDSADQALMWGVGGDVAGAAFDAATVSKVDYAKNTPAAQLISLDVAMVIGQYGVEHGVLNLPTTTVTADGNTEGSPVNNGTLGSAATVSTSSAANPSVITTAAAHGFLSGDTVLIAGHSGSTPSINSSHVVTVTGTTTFTIPVNVTVGGTGGTATRTSSRGGGALWYQLYALDLDGGDSLDLTGRDSVDGATWADLVVAPVITTEYAASDPDTGTAARIAISGSIDRYTAVAYAFAGSPGGGETATLKAGISRAETS